MTLVLLSNTSGFGTILKPLALRSIRQLFKHKYSPRYPIFSGLKITLAVPLKNGSEKVMVMPSINVYFVRMVQTGKYAEGRLIQMPYE